MQRLSLEDAVVGNNFEMTNDKWNAIVGLSESFDSLVVTETFYSFG